LVRPRILPPDEALLVGPAHPRSSVRSERASPERVSLQTEETMDISSLKSQVSHAAREGRDIRHKIGRTQGRERHALWNEKRAVGRRCRCLLLAYGYARGISYRKIEPRCHSGNEPQWQTLANILVGVQPAPANPRPSVLRQIPRPDLLTPEALARLERYESFKALQPLLEAWLGGAPVPHQDNRLGARS